MNSPGVDERVAMTRRPDRLMVMRQDWHHLLFLHWEMPVEAMQPLLPRGLEVDTFEGRAWVGLLPFTITAARPRGLPPVPTVSRFHETNLRTYVHAGGRQPGIWFFSLEAASTLAVLGARLGYRLPYMRARMSVSVRGEAHQPERIDYRSERLWPNRRPARLHVRGAPAGPVRHAEPGTLEHFLVERYVLYTTAFGSLLRARVHHAPYPLQPARAEVFEESLCAAAGITRPDVEPLVHYARLVRTEIFRPELARAL